MLPLLAVIPGPIDGATAIDIASSRFPSGAVRARAVPAGWHVMLDAPHRHFAVPVAVLDVSGRVVGLQDGALHATARVFPANPVVDPEPAEVTLDADVGLIDTRLAVLQCRDEGALEPLVTDLGVLSAHVCTRGPAAPPIDGDYAFDPVPWPADGARDEDDFVASNVFWNTSVGLDWFDEHGWQPVPGFRPFLFVTVNHRDPDPWSTATLSDPTAPLLPFDNAFATGGYTDHTGAWVPPALVFGQGVDIDYGYDADLVHHELAHVIVNSLNGPNGQPDTSFGPSVQGRALNEGLADFFSAAIQEDAMFAEYAATAHPDSVRDLEGFVSCDKDLYGQAHFDSLPFSQGLWAARRSLPPAERADFDADVLAGVATLGERGTFASAWRLLDRVDQAAADVLEEEWRARGFDDCRPIVPPDTPRRFTQIPAAPDGVVPGRVQFRAEVDEADSRLIVTYTQDEWLGLDLWGDAVVSPLRIAVRRGTRITWADGWTHDADEIVESIEVDDWPHADGRHHTRAYEAVVVVEPGPYVLQFLNDTPHFVEAHDVVVAVVAPDPVDITSEAAVEEATLNAGCHCGTVAPPRRVLSIFARR